MPTGVLPLCPGALKLIKVFFLLGIHISTISKVISLKTLIRHHPEIGSMIADHSFFDLELMECPHENELLSPAKYTANYSSAAGTCLVKQANEEVSPFELAFLNKSLNRESERHFYIYCNTLKRAIFNFAANQKGTLNVIVFSTSDKLLETTDYINCKRVVVNRSAKCNIHGNQVQTITSLENFNLKAFDIELK